MKRVDDFLIDRVFQPLADRLARWVSCYGVAAFLLTGFGMEHVTYYIYREEPVWIVLLVLWIVPLLLKSYHMDSQPVHNVMSDDRIRWFPWRIANLLILLPTMPVSLFALSQTSYPDRFLRMVDELAWLMPILALYFMACHKNPPAQRRADLPKGLSAPSLS